MTVESILNRNPRDVTHEQLIGDLRDLMILCLKRIDIQQTKNPDKIKYGALAVRCAKEIGVLKKDSDLSDLMARLTLIEARMNDSGGLVS